MTTTVPSSAGLRECRLYRFYVTHPVSGEVVLGYVGETGRQPFERLLEHLATQPWFDTVVRWEIDPKVYWGKDAVLAAESAAIRAERPLYNVKVNKRNRERIPPPLAIRQRRARDAAKGEARWVHPDDRGGAVRASSPRSPARRRWSSRRKHLTGLGVAWLVATVAAWIVLAVYGLLTATVAEWTPLATVAGTVWVWAGVPCSGRQWGRAFKRARKRLRR